MTTDNGWDAVLPAGVAQSIEDCITELEQQHFTERVHARDVTLWHADQDEAGQRLGWLYVHDTMLPQLDSLMRFVERVRQDGLTDTVLLGMGGSSLGAEVLNDVFGRAPGFPRLQVLDSTVPTAIEAVSHSIDPAHTLFIVSSKSGSTLEPNLLLDYYFHQSRASSNLPAGSRFVAITDPGSSLESTAREHGFRQVFLNPTDIGGRYSVLSKFGMVPAALLGIDVARILTGASHMAELCGPTSPFRRNPGAMLGAFVAGCARVRRDKLTLITSPALKSFGLWAEQLVAESTGKQGKGVVPIIGEPELDVAAYQDDRAFIYLRLQGDRNREADSMCATLSASGFPTLTLAIKDAYSVGAEFYRWEYAIAVVGALLGIDPFDQPDVQRAKDASTSMLEQFVAKGALPNIKSDATMESLVGLLGPRDYFGVTAYLRQRPEIDTVFSDFRQRIASTHSVATTLGYGPRFLHSTGQLHKGGPDECVLLQIVSGHPDDVVIPGKPYSFGTVVDAQALGDLRALQTLNRRVGRLILENDDATLLAQALRQR